MVRWIQPEVRVIKVRTIHTPRQDHDQSTNLPSLCTHFYFFVGWACDCHTCCSIYISSVRIPQLVESFLGLSIRLDSARNMTMATLSAYQFVVTPSSGIVHVLDGSSVMSWSRPKILRSSLSDHQERLPIYVVRNICGPTVATPHHHFHTQPWDADAENQLLSVIHCNATLTQPSPSSSRNDDKRSHLPTALLCT